MAYAIFGNSYVQHLKDFTKGDLRFKYDCNYYGVSGMATDHKFESAFDQLCLIDQGIFIYLCIYVFIYLFIYSYSELEDSYQTGFASQWHIC